MKVGFDGSIKIEFHGAKVTSDGGLLAYRDLLMMLLDYSTPSLPIFMTITQVVISNMLCHV